MTQKVQLALQGGGAKVVALMAAMEAIEELTKGPSPVIEVTQIAGTSAGSIVAALFAAGVPMRDALKYLENKEPSEIFSRSRFPIWTIIRKKPLYDVGNLLRPHLAALLRLGTRAKQNKSPPTRFDELNIPTIVAVSDIRSRDGAHCRGRSPLLPGIMDSCSLPFIFKNLSSTDNACLVDGGICANLPVELLEANYDEYGPILAISFAPDECVPPNSFKSYGLSLLFTAMDYSVKRIKQQLGPRSVFEITTSIDTLEFDKACGKKLRDLQMELDGICQAADDFVRKFITHHKNELSSAAGRIVELTEDPWKAAASQDVIAKQLARSMHDHFRINKAAQASSKIRYVQSRLHVVGRSIASLGQNLTIGSEEADSVITESVYEVTEGRLISHVVAMGLAASNLLKTKPEVRVLTNGVFEVDSGNVFNVAALDREEPSKRYMIICFKEPLPAGTTFKITVKDEVKGFFSPLLGEQRMDELYLRPTRGSVSPPELIEITLTAPKVKGWRVTMKPHEEMSPDSQGKLMSKAEVELFQQLAPVNYESQGWRWVRVGVDQRYVVRLAAEEI